MSDSQNLSIVRRLYESGMAPDVVAEIVATDFVFDITPGFPFGGVYHGWPDVAENSFGRLTPSYESFGPITEDFHATGNLVVVQGHYHAVSKSGQAGDIRFVHTWHVVDGHLTHLRQTTDSHIAHQLLS